MGLFGLFNKEKKETLDKGLTKTKESVFAKLSRAVMGKSKVDDEVLLRSSRMRVLRRCRIGRRAA